MRDRFSKVITRKRSEGMIKRYASCTSIDSSSSSSSSSSGQRTPRNSQDIGSNTLTTPSESSQSSQVSSTSTSYPKASLLGIPGELRNQIYRYALLEDQLIKLNPQDHQLPGLLRTCRQIADEATDIYQTENNFQVDAWNMKLSIPENYAEHWMSSLEHCHFWITMRGAPDWENFWGWLRRYSTGEVPGLASGQPSNEAEILAQAFEIVHGLKKNLQFNQILPVLEAWKKSVVLAGADFVFP